jgi:hypothetical protein
MYSVLNRHNVAKHTEFYWDSYGSMWLPQVMQGVSKRALQWYSKCYCVASVMKTFTPWTMDSLYAWSVGNCRFSISFRPALGLIQSPMEIVLGGSFPGGKTAGAWSWAQLQLVPIHIHGVLLNWLSTGTNSLFFFTTVKWQKRKVNFLRTLNVRKKQKYVDYLNTVRFPLFSKIFFSFLPLLRNKNLFNAVTQVEFTSTAFKIIEWNDTQRFLLSYVLYGYKLNFHQSASTPSAIALWARAPLQ